MLVLSRRVREKIVFPALNVTVQVVAVKGGGVRLGIQAPSEVDILREELQPPADSPGANRRGPRNEAAPEKPAGPCEPATTGTTDDPAPDGRQLPTTRKRCPMRTCLLSPGATR
jgi:carbon storage regulator CsrA